MSDILTIWFSDIIFARNCDENGDTFTVVMLKVSIVTDKGKIVTYR